MPWWLEIRYCAFLISDKPLEGLVKYIKIDSKMKTIGVDNNVLWITTNDLVKLIARTGKALNTGTNILIAKEIFDACTAVVDESRDFMSIGSQKGTRYKSRYIKLEDSWYEVLAQDAVLFDFSEVGLIGAAFIADLESITTPLTELPEDDGEWMPDYGEEETIINKVLRDTQ